MQIRPRLTVDHRESLASRGYAVVSELLPVPLLNAARNTICASVNADLQRPETWYAHEPLDWSVVPVHHAQEFWNVRQWPTVHELFASLLENERLWVTTDCAVFKAPASNAFAAHVDESVLHWDLDPRGTNSSSYQGMRYLTDAGSGDGTFQCVPSIFEELDRYLEAHPGPALEKPIDLRGHDVVDVPVRSGDLVVWNARLPHQGGPNRGTQPRVSLPITMHPEGSDAERQERIECWRQKRAPPW